MSSVALARVFGIAVAFHILLAMPAISFGQPVARNEGAKNYTPSRLEWLAVDLNARLRVPLNEGTAYSIEFIPLERQDTLLIAVRYLPTANREAMNLQLANIRELIDMKAKYYQWSSRLTVREDVKMLDVSKPR